jgi:putative transposase
MHLDYREFYRRNLPHIQPRGAGWHPAHFRLRAGQHPTPRKSMKNKLAFREYYKRRLPHIQIAGATYFITFRLAKSLPSAALEKLGEEKQKINKLPESQKAVAHQAWFVKYDDYLDRALHGNVYLRNEHVANMVAESILFRDAKDYDLIAYCIMFNHVHLVCTPLMKEKDAFFGLTEILHSLKRHTAREANKILQRSGTFWRDESYDHFIRDDAELERIMKYVLYNPAKAGLVKDQADWKWSYCKYEMQCGLPIRTTIRDNNDK